MKIQSKIQNHLFCDKCPSRDEKQFNTLKPTNIANTSLMIPRRQQSGMSLLEEVSCLNADPQIPVPWLISGDDPHSEVSIAD